MSKIPKLPHFMDKGFHRASRNRAESNRNYDENYDKIFDGNVTGKIVEQKPGYTKIVIDIKK